MSPSSQLEMTQSGGSGGGGEGAVLGEPTEREPLAGGPWAMVEQGGVLSLQDNGKRVSRARHARADAAVQSPTTASHSEP